MSRKWKIKLNNTRKTGRLTRIWKICCWMHIPDWIYRSCIVIHKSLVLDGSLHYVQCVPYAEILQICLLFSMIWNCRFQSPAVSKQRDVRWCGFRNSIPISIGYLWNACIDLAISTPSCSYCIRNRYWQNHRSILPNFLLLLDLIRLNSIVCHDQTTRYTMMRISLIDSAINWLCLKFPYWYGYLESFMLILHI